MMMITPRLVLVTVALAGLASLALTNTNIGECVIGERDCHTVVLQEAAIPQ